FEAVRKRMGTAPALSARELGDACQSSVEILLVVRALSVRPDEPAEFFRFDRCQLSARAVASPAEDPDAIAAKLMLLAPPISPTIAKKSTVAPWAVAGAGAVIALSGAILAGVAERERNHLASSSCAMMSRCDPASYRTWETTQNAGFGLVAVGGA